MRVAIIVFEALRTFDRPATRREIERESGLGHDQVHDGLRTLARAGVLHRMVERMRLRGLYQLVAGARPPATLRGRYERTPEHRQKLGELVRAARARGPARDAPAPAPAMPRPGVPRVIVKGVLDLKPSRQYPANTEPCLLDIVWRGIV
jgi:hypothetical protein